MDNNKFEYPEFYKYPKEVVCVFKDGNKQKLILEKLENDSLIFKKYYNQKNCDCTMTSVKSLRVIDRKFNENVITLPYSVKCFFKDGTKQNLILEKIKGDSLIFKNKNGNVSCKTLHINTIEAIRILKNNMPLVSASVTTAFTIASSIGVYYALTSKKFNPIYTEDFTIDLINGTVKFLSIASLGLTSTFMVKQLINMKKTFYLNNYTIYVL
ncbi:MAG: hypothetical protein ACOYMA_08105 [Bacteroidia bacterium]